MAVFHILWLEKIHGWALYQQTGPAVSPSYTFHSPHPLCHEKVEPCFETDKAWMRNCTSFRCLPKSTTQKFFPLWDLQIRFQEFIQVIQIHPDITLIQNRPSMSLCFRNYIINTCKIDCGTIQYICIKCRLYDTTLTSESFWKAISWRRLILYFMFLAWCLLSLYCKRPVTIRLPFRQG